MTLSPGQKKIYILSNWNALQLKKKKTKTEERREKKWRKLFSFFFSLPRDDGF